MTFFVDSKMYYFYIFLLIREIKFLEDHCWYGVTV